MNIQFSLTTSAATRGTSEPALSAESVSSVYSTDKIRNLKDLTEKGLQGVSVPFGEEQLIRNIDKALRTLEGPETTLDVSIHDRTHQIMVKVLNKDTGEVIREIPPEKTLDIVANMMELVGIIVDEKI
ncbi:MULTISPECIES: flagellar protein FlaG [Paenibacillus]|uniref:flagellar protein FlaG n=1 Tax=Paenibacillus TaxID=44249 RepID=UPI0030F81279